MVDSFSIKYLSCFGKTGRGDGEFYVPRGITIDALGNVYVADLGNMRIQKFDSQGRFLMKFRVDGLPNAMAVDKNGSIYVADVRKDCVHKFDALGHLLMKYGKQSRFGSWRGSGDGEFDKPRSVHFDAVGNLYVVDSSNHRVQKFDTEGRQVLCT